ncbi:tubulin-specific chaperone A-like isoform X2 [Uloborus diversus]|uniref:tubulin-specific chaperone A-like isoform X2 n=1 Tax=Uloborus diversus TaxID=327109 RepID=UPI0024096699|nr:tubulin-specific chaperone A-like isoform X2 [Uloborus diversus]
MATPALKQIKIKGGVVKRIAKEVSYYEKEILREKQRLEKMKKDGKDEYALKHQEEVIRESARMVPHCTNELRIAYNELKNLLESEVDFCDTEEYQASNAILGEVGLILTK